MSLDRGQLTSQLDMIPFLIDGGDSTPSTGVAFDVPVPFSGTITQVDAVADQSGSIVIDLWKDSYANFPPTNDDSITASAPITISTATKSTDSTLTGWTTSVARGDIIRVNIDSVTSITRVTVMLYIKKG